jgi:putative transposase
MRRTAQLLRSLLSILLITADEGIQFLWLAVSPRAELSAEALFLRKQLAFYQEHQVQPRKLTDAARFSLVPWSQLFNWRAALMIVKPETLIGWHRKGFKLFWRWRSLLGRPRIPENLRQLIVRIVQENPTWGEERIAAELSVKFGILVSPRTVRAYWPQDSDPRGCRRISSQHWRTFVRNHAKVIVASDFLVAITAGFRVLYVFVLMEVGSRRIVRCNGTSHPTAAWTLQQFREAIPSDHTYRFLIHDRDSIFSAEVDDELGEFGRGGKFYAHPCRRRRPMLTVNG